MKSYNTITEIFLETTEKADESKPAFRYKRDGEYTGLTHLELRHKVECLSIALMELGIHKNDRVGLVSENRIEWIISCFAINCIGAVDVPLFPILTAKQEEYIFTDCGVSAIIVSNNFQLKKILEFKDKLDSLRHIIVMNDDFDSKNVYVHSFKDLLKRGCELKPLDERKQIFLNAAEKIKPGDLLTLIYTSGTTGNPKGVMLTHKNVASNVSGSINALGDLSHEYSLCFLPLCHAYERTTGFLTLFASGAVINLAESIESVSTDIGEVKPTLITTVPRLLETVRKKILRNIEKEKPLRQKMFNWAVKTGIKYYRKKQEDSAGFFLRQKYNIADNMVFSKIREKLGGNLRRFVSGGASLPEDVGFFFCAIGIDVIQGYGLTEASPVVAVNRPGINEIGTIGPPLDNVEIKIAGDGELLVRGPNIMKGYWNSPEETDNAIDEEGWLYTGDIVKLSEKGNLIITDRKKNIFVNSGGKNIAPQPIESTLSQSRFIEHVIVIGDKQDYVTALISPDMTQLKQLAEEFGFETEDGNELLTNPKIIRHIKNEIDFLQKDFSKFERVRKFRLLSEPFTVDGGELSPKMSIKRHVIHRKYSNLIKMMYEG